MDDDRIIGSVAGTEGAVKKVPSLALALFPRPELLVAGDSWLASDGSGDGTDRKAQNVADPCKGSTRGK